MSALTAFRDHCRAMAEKCDRYTVGLGGLKPLAGERDLWIQLADEIDDYLSSSEPCINAPLCHLPSGHPGQCNGDPPPGQEALL